MTSDQRYYFQLRRDAERWVKSAVRIIEEQSEHLERHMKDEVDLATNADVASENFLIGQITAAYPRHRIFSEESGEIGNGQNEDSEYTWTIDPLDGTKEFARGGREYNCLVSVERKHIIVAGVIYRHGINELYAASYGSGTELNGTRIHVSDGTDMSTSLAGFHMPKGKNPEESIDRGMAVLRRLIGQTYRVRPGWDDAHHNAWVAEGLLDANIICPDVNKWHDIAASLLCVTEAGGRVTDWDGKPIRDRSVANGVVVSNGKLHQKLLELIHDG